MRADRLLAIMLILQTQGKTTTLALANRLEVSRRTILRDLEALSMAGVPVQTEAGHGGGVALDEHYRVSLTGLNEAEVRALFVATAAGPLHDVGLGAAAGATLLKLFAALPSLHRQAVEQMQQRLLLDPTLWWPRSETPPCLDTLRAAVFDDGCVQVRYERSDGQVVERQLEPYSLVAKASVWYVIARHAGELHTYRVSRFLSVVRLPERFERAATFDLAQYWQAHINDFIANMPSFAFTLRLAASGLRLLRLYAAGGYIIRETAADGSTLLVDVQLSSPEEARMLVLGLGTAAEIIAPDSLRDAVLLQAQQIVARAAAS